MSRGRVSILRASHTVQNWIPLTELPSLSSGGDQHTMPITLGTTSRIPPDTPDLAGRPTCSRETKQLQKGWLCVQKQHDGDKVHQHSDGKSHITLNILRKILELFRFESKSTVPSFFCSVSESRNPSSTDSGLKSLCLVY